MQKDLSSTALLLTPTYVEFVTDERVETLIEAHENAFLAFDRVSKSKRALYVALSGQRAELLPP